MRCPDVLNFPCLSRATLFAACLLGLAACSSRESVWSKPHTSDAERTADYRQCTGETRSATGAQLGIDQDIASSRGNDWRRSGTYDSEVERTTGSDGAVADSILTACMRGKGYQHR
jgi:hypothetical protein